MKDVLLMYALHVCAWFILGGLSSVTFGRSNLLKLTSAAALGFVSFVAQIIFKSLFY